MINDRPRISSKWSTFAPSFVIIFLVGTTFALLYSMDYILVSTDLFITYDEYLVRTLACADKYVEDVTSLQSYINISSTTNLTYSEGYCRAWEMYLHCCWEVRSAFNGTSLNQMHEDTGMCENMSKATWTSFF
ncbi:uncharacterized protein LOC143451452 [Clavelina lepadiformis]|uniref:Uncharacterized protein n=1 Tax=Clavelina lepadiformis TaxID=159417 RepID=A0ABP0GX39_CLALP